MPKKISSPKSSSKTSSKELGWHFFLPAVGGFVVTWIFSNSVTLSLKVGVAVLILSAVGMWMHES